MANIESGSGFNRWINTRTDPERAALGFAGIAVMALVGTLVINEWNDSRTSANAPMPTEQNITVPETAAPPAITLEQPLTLHYPNLYLLAE